MELFILRHGKAEAYCANDAGRQLVAKGREEVTQVVLASLQDLERVAQIWVSPLVRARQTAEIAGQALNLELITCDFLTPEADPAYILQKLTAVDFQSLLIVSHQPLVSRLVEMACGAASGTYPMDTAALACIDFEIPGKSLGDLRWLRHPLA